MKNVIHKTVSVLLTLLLLILTSGAFLRKNNHNLLGPSGVEGEIIQKPQPGKIPEIFAPGIISTGNHEFSCSFSPDGKEFYFTRRVPEFDRNRIMISELKKDGWTKPVLVPTAGDYEGIEPYVTPDGKHFYFQTWRPDIKNVKPSLDIWVMKKINNNWGPPVHLGHPFNPMKAMYLSMSRRGKVFTTDISDKTGKSKIVYTTLKNEKYASFKEISPLINSTGTEFYPCISLNEDYILFTRTDKNKKSHIYISYNFPDSGWSEPSRVNLGPENVSMPRLSPDEKYLFFTHVPERLKGDIYWVDAKIVRQLVK